MVLRITIGICGDETKNEVLRALSVLGRLFRFRVRSKESKICDKYAAMPRNGIDV